jgi:hypothetical protein
MEGFFWRFTTPDGRVVIAACALTEHPLGRWGLVFIAAEPGGFLRTATTDIGWAAQDRFEVRIGDLLRYRDEQLDVDLGDGARLAARLEPPEPWPRRALHGLGLGSVVPGLSQYWHPHPLGARVRGEAVVDGERWSQEAAQAYGEKNWGRRFPTHWWWGQAQGFDRPDVCVAFAGGQVSAGPLTTHVTSVVGRIGDRLFNLAPPFARVRAAVVDGQYRVSAVGPRSGIHLAAETVGTQAHPVPVPLSTPGTMTTSSHCLSARLDLRAERDGRENPRGRKPSCRTRERQCAVTAARPARPESLVRPAMPVRPISPALPTRCLPTRQRRSR